MFPSRVSVVPHFLPFSVTSVVLKHSSVTCRDNFDLRIGDTPLCLEYPIKVTIYTRTIHTCTSADEHLCSFRQRMSTTLLLWSTMHRPCSPSEVTMAFNMWNCRCRSLLAVFTRSCQPHERVQSDVHCINVIMLATLGKRTSRDLMYPYADLSYSLKIAIISGRFGGAKFFFSWVLLKPSE